MKITLISTMDHPSDQGIRTISAVLKEKGHEVNLIFMRLMEGYYDLYTKENLKQLKDLCNSSSLIGINCFASTWLKANQIITYLKKELDVPIIFGGVHATLSPGDCIKYSDIVCVGEGEKAIVEVADSIQNKKPLDNIKNLWIRKGDKILKNPVRDLIDNLDKLPRPDYDISKHYILDEEGIRLFEEKDFRDYIFVSCGRGCPYGCTYCSNGKFNEIYKNHRKKIVRNHRVDYVIRILREIKDRFNLSFIDLRDDTFTIRDLGEIKDFCKKYKKEIGIKYKCSADPRTITEDKIKELVNSGCFQISVGIQGCERVNKEIYKRYINHKDIIRTGKILNKYKGRLSVHYDLIINNPYEEPGDILETFKFLKKLPKPFMISPCSLTFFPGSQLYERGVREGKIKNIKDTGIDLKFNQRGQHILRTKKNIYLNTILSLTRGYVTDNKYGSINVKILDILLSKKWVNFFQDKNFLTGIIPHLLITFDFVKYEIVRKMYLNLTNRINRETKKR